MDMLIGFRTASHGRQKKPHNTQVSFTLKGLGFFPFYCLYMLTFCRH
ncbi:BnaC06g14060D [Brassica napus]|uniref:Uncharacterized protein n=2 Tax=Brassica TaxID=3705 RepID=A0A3P6GZV6_BRAOL|nr:unnamed protein product [Brassica napus]CDY13351.1 BnaC06g14060D [Brassica napus]VDD61795.1 unnamed protein product [Brassica oleracea]